eukprot:669136-Lingulodinium_polyedra.AAC.1
MSRAARERAPTCPNARRPRVGPYQRTGNPWAEYRRWGTRSAGRLYAPIAALLDRWGPTKLNQTFAGPLLPLQ